MFEGTAVEWFVFELVLEFVLLFVLFDEEAVVLLLDAVVLESRSPFVVPSAPNAHNPVFCSRASRANFTKESLYFTSGG